MPGAAGVAAAAAVAPAAAAFAAPTGPATAAPAGSADAAAAAAASPRVGMQSAVSPASGVSSGSPAATAAAGHAPGPASESAAAAASASRAPTTVDGSALLVPAQPRSRSNAVTTPAASPGGAAAAAATAAGARARALSAAIMTPVYAIISRVRGLSTTSRVATPPGAEAGTARAACAPAAAPSVGGLLVLAPVDEDEGAPLPGGVDLEPPAAAAAAAGAQKPPLWSLPLHQGLSMPRVGSGLSMPRVGSDVTLPRVGSEQNLTLASSAPRSSSARPGGGGGGGGSPFSTPPSVAPSPGAVGRVPSLDDLQAARGWEGRRVPSLDDLQAAGARAAAGPGPAADWRYSSNEAARARVADAAASHASRGGVSQHWSPGGGVASHGVVYFPPRPPAALPPLRVAPPLLLGGGAAAGAGSWPYLLHGPPGGGEAPPGGGGWDWGHPHPLDPAGGSAGPAATTTAAWGDGMGGLAHGLGMRLPPESTHPAFSDPPLAVAAAAAATCHPWEGPPHAVLVGGAAALPLDAGADSFVASPGPVLPSERRGGHHPHSSRLPPRAAGVPGDLSRGRVALHHHHSDRPLRSVAARRVDVAGSNRTPPGPQGSSDGAEQPPVRKGRSRSPSPPPGHAAASPAPPAAGLGSGASPHPIAASASPALLPADPSADFAALVDMAPRLRRPLTPVVHEPPPLQPPSQPPSQPVVRPRAVSGMAGGGALSAAWTADAWGASLEWALAAEAPASVAAAAAAPGPAPAPPALLEVVDVVDTVEATGRGRPPSALAPVSASELDPPLAPRLGTSDVAAVEVATPASAGSRRPTSTGSRGGDADDDESVLAELFFSRDRDAVQLL